MPAKKRNQMFLLYFQSVFNRLREIPRKTLKSLNNFHIFVNDIPFSCNSYYASCISDHIFSALLKDHYLSEFRLLIPKVLIERFQNIYFLLQGSEIYIEENELEQFNELATLLEFDYLKDYIKENFPNFASTIIDDSLENALLFLQNSNKNPIEFDTAVSIAAIHFSEIPFSTISHFSIQVLETILNSNQLRVRNENQLFLMVQKLAKFDQKYFRLLTYIQFPFVDPILLRKFFQNFPFEDLDQQLFDQIKIRLFCEVIPNKIGNMDRWLETPILFDSEEVKLLLNLLDSFVGSNGNRVLTLNEIISQYSSTVKQNEKKVIYLPLKSKSREGVFHFLSHKMSSEDVKRIVNVTSSSTEIGFPENLLDWSQSFWVSADEENSWICFRFVSMKLSLSGYRINSHGQINRASGWVLEGSNSGNNGKFLIFEIMMN